VLFDQRRQFPEGLLRFGLREMLVVDLAKLVKAPGACSVPTFFGIAECAKMDVLHSLLLDPNTQPVLREALFARERQGPNVGQEVDADSLERGNEPINVGAFIANRVERRLGKSFQLDVMLLCTG
jgi:hypothetical protein